MGRSAYLLRMRQRLDDLAFQIQGVKGRLAERPDLASRRDLRQQMELLEMRRDDLRDKLATLEDDGEGMWPDLQYEVEAEWDALIQDFEERLGSLSQ